MPSFTFSSKALLACVSIVLAWTAYRCVAVQAGLSPPGETTERWMGDVTRFRDHLYAQQDDSRPTIWIVGGSSTLFGIDSAALGKATGYNIKNHALHASLSFELSVSKISEQVRRGDIVVLAHEFQVFDNKVGSAFDYTNYLRHLSFASFKPPLSVLAQLYLHVPLKRWFDGLVHYVMRNPGEQPYPAERTMQVILNAAKTPSAAVYDVNSVSPAGDFAIDEPMTRWTWLNQPSIYNVSALSKDSLKRRSDFVATMKARGASTIMIAPVFLDLKDEAMHAPAFWSSVEGVRQSVVDSGLTLSCDPLDGVLSSIFRFDTYFHANKWGARTRSEKLGACLKAFIDGADIDTLPIDPQGAATKASNIIDEQKIDFGRGDVRFQRMLRSLTLLNAEIQKFQASSGRLPIASELSDGALEVDRSDIVIALTATTYRVSAKPSPATQGECAVVAANWPAMIQADKGQSDLTLCNSYGYSGGQ